MGMIKLLGVAAGVLGGVLCVIGLCVAYIELML